MSTRGALSAAWTAAAAAMPLGWSMVGVVRRERALRLMPAVTDASLPDWCALAEDDALVLHDAWGEQPFQALMRLAVKLREIRGPRVGHREIQSLAPDQVRRLLTAIHGDRDEALYLVAIATGLRQGELLGLRWTDVDLAAGTLTVRQALQRIDGVLQVVETKTARSRRTIPLPELALEALRAHKAAQTGQIGSLYVFTTPKGTPLDGTNVTKRLQALLAAAGLPRVTFHALRHTTASLLLAQGVHPRVVMEQLGHSQIALTMNTYSHVIPALERDAADRMNALLTSAAR